MTVSLLLPSVTAAIKNLSVTGVTIKDYSGIAGTWQSATNVLYPNPEGFITDFLVEFPTILEGSSAPMDVSYTLNYRFLGSLIGDLSQMPTQYADMMAKVVLILNTLLGTDSPYSGKVHMRTVSISVGSRSDPSGNVFHGADIAMRIQEMQN